MKKCKKILSLTLSVMLLLCCIPLTAKADTQSLSVGNTNTVAGNSGKIAITAGDFEGFIGGFHFEIRFPQIAQINNVYLGNDKLTCVSNGGTGYKVGGDNTLILTDTCNYGGDTALGNHTVYYVEFIVKADAATGDYPVVITENTYIVADNDDTALIPLKKENGIIRVPELNDLKADIDKSGKADAADLSALKKRLIGADCGSIFSETAADVHEDGTVDIRDLVAIKKYLARPVVYLSDRGDDSNTGDSEYAPVATLNRAIDQVYEGGTVYITDTYTVDDAFHWNKHLKPVNISGGTLDASAASTLAIADNTTFTDVTLKFRNSENVYADGFAVKISDDVTVTGKPCLFGGGTYKVETTALEVYAGSYQQIYGGGYGADVTGDAHVVIGGNVNSDLDETNHSGGVYIFGGGNNGTVGGNIHLTIKDNAKSTYIFGAGNGVDSNVSGKINVNINGGAFMGAYAGSANGRCSDTELTMSGGKIEQIFGGCSGTSMEGNVRLNILGGTVTRRIYGGCYNELTSGGVWTSQYYVNGNTTVFLSSKATVKFGSFTDYGIFACSRYKSHFAGENSTIIYENSEAKSKFSGLLGQQDWASKWISSWPNAAKTITTQN